MNILVINGSPKGEKSDTMKLTRAFLEGLGEEAEVIDTMKQDIHPCLGCYACWFATPGRCCQKDDMEEILKKYQAADLVIWSTPIYCYGVPSNCKALMDRMVALNQPSMYVGADGRTHHPGTEDGTKPTLLISGCGLPELKGNYDGMLFQFERMFGQKVERILCAETPAFSFPNTRKQTDSYLQLVKEAGREWKETGKLSAHTRELLDAPMIEPEKWREWMSQG